MGEETPRATLSRGAQRPRDGGREARAQNGTQAGKAFFGALVENNAEEERAHARNDRCQRCSGACHWSTAIFCVRTTAANISKQQQTAANISKQQQTSANSSKQQQTNCQQQR